MAGRGESRRIGHGPSMRIVITGASGNVGSALLRRLGRDGHELVGVARRPPASEPPFDAVSRWSFLDLTRDESVPRLVETFRGAEAVVHLAWGFQPTHDQRYLHELGVGGTRRVLEAAAAAGVPHLEHMSSIGAYSRRTDDRPVDESWPTQGIASSPYSRHKVAAERLVDGFEREHPDTVVTRMRPGIIGQRDAGSSLLRYALPALVPARALDWLPVLPLDKRLSLPMVHADDVADAFARALEARAAGAFNLAAPPALTVDDLATVLGARHVDVPAPVLRALMSASWHLRLQQLDPGWLDMAYSVPVLDVGRAGRELGWSPRVDALSVLAETVAGMRDRATRPSPVLRGRSVAGELTRLVRRGPVSSRPKP